MEVKSRCSGKSEERRYKKMATVAQPSPLSAACFLCPFRTGGKKTVPMEHEWERGHSHDLIQFQTELYPAGHWKGWCVHMCTFQLYVLSSLHMHTVPAACAHALQGTTYSWNGSAHAHVPVVCAHALLYVPMHCMWCPAVHGHHIQLEWVHLPAVCTYALQGTYSWMGIPAVCAHALAGHHIQLEWVSACACSSCMCPCAAGRRIQLEWVSACAHSSCTCPCAAGKATLTL